MMSWWMSCVQVRILKHGKPSTKVALSVDVAAGKLTAVKGSKEALDDKNVFPFDKSECLSILGT